MIASRFVRASVVTFAAAAGASAQQVLFDFENAPYRSPLPVDVTADGVTAHLSASGQGYSIQRADTMGFTPVGFSGLCIYPSSVFASDLTISFSATVTGFSILYAPQELGCDDSARMRVTAYMNGSLVGDATTTAPNPGTWPSHTLSYASAQGFNSVVVHYDARPTCTDFGPIFMADNVRVTKAASFCPADFNQSGGVTVQDIFDFLAAYFAGAPAADFNASGSVSVQDIFDFLAAYFAACP